MTVPVHILAIGDELLLGRTVDSNSAYLARWCSDRGLAVAGISVLGDEQDRIAEVLRARAAECDLLLVTGGLGPTVDDRTRHALAQAADRALHESGPAWRAIERYYHRVRPGTTVSESNRRQALMPRGAKMLANDRGTAPGILCRVGRAWVACMPGVPVEMHAMVERLAARLPRLLPHLQPPTVAEVHFAGIGESAAQDRLGELLQGSSQLAVGITAHERGHLTVRVVGSSGRVRRRVSQVRRVLDPCLLTADGIAPSLIALLAERGLLISAAESCTCGHVVAAIGAVPGASQVLRQSHIAYHNESKIRDLGVPDTLLAEHGAVSQACAMHMAGGQRLRSGADVACATTGIAGPGGGSRLQPVGTVWLAVASVEGVSTRCLALRGERARIQRRAAAACLLLAWQHLREGPQQPMPKNW